MICWDLAISTLLGLCPPSSWWKSTFPGIGEEWNPMISKQEQIPTIHFKSGFKGICKMSRFCLLVGWFCFVWISFAKSSKARQETSLSSVPVRKHSSRFKILVQVNPRQNCWPSGPQMNMSSYRWKGDSKCCGFFFSLSQDLNQFQPTIMHGNNFELAKTLCFRIN